MKKLILKNKVPLILVIINFLLAIIFFVIFKQVVKVNSEAASWKRRTQDFKKAKTIIREINEDKIEQERQNLKKVPVGEVAPVTAIKEIVNIAQKALIRDINIIQPKEAQEQTQDIPGVSELALEIKMSCEYNKLIDFLEKLKDSSVLMQIGSLKVTRQDEKLPYLEVSFTLNTYSILDKEKTASRGK